MFEGADGIQWTVAEISDIFRLLFIVAHTEDADKVLSKQGVKLIMCRRFKVKENGSFLISKISKLAVKPGLTTYPPLR